MMTPLFEAGAKGSVYHANRLQARRCSFSIVVGFQASDQEIVLPIGWPRGLLIIALRRESRLGCEQIAEAL